jgi:hypothetical protein
MIHTHQAPRCIPGRHGEAVPARPTRRGRGETSPRGTGSTTSGASTGEHTHETSIGAPQHAQLAPAARHLIRELGGGRSRGGRPPQSPRGGSARRFHSVELMEGTGAKVLPKVATAEVTRAGRRGKAEAAANRSRQ